MTKELTPHQIEQVKEIAESIDLEIEKGEEEEIEVVEITRNEYLEAIDGKIEKWSVARTKAGLEQIRAELKLAEHNDNKRRMLILESRGIKLTFFDSGEGVFYDQREAEPVGFKGQRNNWQRIWEERERKKNERIK